MFYYLNYFLKKMKIKTDRVHYDFNTGIHWSVINIELENGNATVLACASRNYLADKYKSPGKATKETKEKWLNDLLTTIESLGKKFKVDSIHKWVYSFTPEGKLRGYKFLEEIEI